MRPLHFRVMGRPVVLLEISPVVSYLTPGHHLFLPGPSHPDNRACPFIPSPAHYEIMERQFSSKQLFSPLPVTERSSPVNGRGRVRAGVVAGTDAPPVQFHRDMVFVPLIQEDPTVFICSNLGGRTLTLAACNHPNTLHQKKQACLVKGFYYGLLFSSWL